LRLRHVFRGLIFAEESRLSLSALRNNLSFGLIPSFCDVIFVTWRSHLVFREQDASAVGPGY